MTSENIISWTVLSSYSDFLNVFKYLCACFRMSQRYLENN